MNRVGEFKKVSFEQFCSAMKAEFYKQDDASKTAEEAIRSLYDAIKLPERSTAGSAGYDLVSPTSFVLDPGQSIKIPTGIRRGGGSVAFREVASASSTASSWTTPSVSSTRITTTAPTRGISSPS